ncbi:MAG: hypothetical protein ACI8XM_000234 [Haloarculaceae archaeon]|jgi:hypothetical protein
MSDPDKEGDETPDDPTEPEGSDPPSEPTEGERDDGDERPEIEDDERADLDLSGVDLDSVDDGGDDEGEEPTHEPTEDSGADGSTQGSSPLNLDDEATWGDMYVDVLATVLVSVVDEYGEGGREMAAEEIEELANQPPIALNEQADRVFEEMGGTRDLPPGQALVIGSATVAGSVLLRETDVAADLAGELAEQTGGSA